MSDSHMFELPRSGARRVALLLLVPMYVFAGFNHFWDPGFYLAMMPPWLPLHAEAVYASGVIEVILGLAVLVRPLRALAGIGLVLLLIAVFPANLHMALDAESFAPAPAWALYARLPMQLALMAWAYWATRDDHAPVPAHASA